MRKRSRKNLTVLTSTRYLETVQTRATFDLPSFELVDQSVAVNTSETSSIETIESTRKPFNHSFWTLFGGGGGPQTGRTGGTFDKVLPSVNLTGYPSPLASSDGSFQALFQGKDAIAEPQSLLGPANTGRLIEAVERLYRIITAQSLHTAQGRRMPVTSTFDDSQPPPPPIGRGTMINPNSRRLYQSHIATYFPTERFSYDGAYKSRCEDESADRTPRYRYTSLERTMQEQKNVHMERIVSMEMEPMVCWFNLPH
ncbi:MAG: hypothetical protein Q9180_004003 [Flavoplaca navasiana]